MNSKSFFSNKKFVLLVLMIIAFLISALLEQRVIENTKINWDNILSENLSNAEEKILSAIHFKSNSLIETTKILKSKLNRALPKNEISDCFDIVNNQRDYTIELYDENDGLVCWNTDPIFLNENNDILNRNIDQTFFYKKQLFTYLSLVDTLKYLRKIYIIVSVPLEKNYKLAKDNFRNLSLSDSLSALLSTSVDIEYDQNAVLSKDGRKHSFNILNNYKNKIGAASIDKPALDSEFKKISNLFSAAQSILFLFLVFLIVYLLKPFISSIQNKIVKYSVVSFLLLIIRILLFLFEIPSGYLTNDLTNASSFSSVFALGIIRSPLEFFITLVFVFVIIWIGFIYFLNYFVNRQNRTRRWNKILILFISTFLVLLIYRGLGASIRSVVFDSTIRYFKEFAVIPSAHILLMNVNILILGFICLLLTTILVLWVFESFKLSSENIIPLAGIILFGQVTGFLFDLFQKQPQGTPLIRILFLLLVILLAYYFYKTKTKIVFFIYTAIASSILTISLLSYYNSEIERESLKTTAHELTNSDSDILKFILYQTLVNSQDEDEIKRSLTNHSDYAPALFTYWTKSLIYKENIPTNFSLYGKEGKLLGSFSTNGVSDSLDKELFVSTIKPEVKVVPSTFESKRKLVGITPLRFNGSNNGYFACSIEHNLEAQAIKKVPAFLASSRAGISSATDIEKLKIFFIKDDKIINSFGTPGLNQNEAVNLESVNVNERNEAWLNANINREEHIIYVLKYGRDGNQKVAVALELSAIALRLSNFFKIFFIHSILIMAFLILYSFTNIKKWKEYFSSYRTKLTFVLILVSAVPLIVIAVYFRNLSDSRSKEISNERLTEYALQIESYLKRYLNLSSVDNRLVYGKAVNDLNINFSIYGDKKLIFSSKDNYHQVGLFNSVINPIVYQRCIVNGSEKTFLEEFTDQTKYFSVYKVSDYASGPTIIEVNNLLNKSSFSIADDEPDLFLFGIFSLVLIILIILSTIFARQISSPINKLTMATKSVGSGDLNVIVVNKSSGEIAELTSGFNKMVEQLKKSQIELAQLEREIAWKEMAKQVAHEIKNPLTPMKLSVQQLVASYNDKSKKFDEIFHKVTSTLLSQIEILRNIAVEFSNFARMPKPNIERIDLNDVIGKAISLFIDDGQKINFEFPAKRIFVNADNDQMSRTIINLIRNSIQANANKISVELTSSNSFAVVRVIDNGEGINPGNIARVFDDNFTTKTKGMGLGLSMAKKFIEAVDGTIEIEKTSPEGTTVTIKIPITD